MAEEHFSKLERTTASTIEVALDSKPMGGHQALIDVERSMALLDYIQIQPKLGPSGSHLSAIAAGGLAQDAGPTRYASVEERMEALELFLDERALGWRNHIVQEGRQAKISLCEASSYKLHPLAFAKHNIVLAGAWVESTHTLADGAVESGQNAGRLISKMQG
jgi:hypothetical protein